MAQKGKHSQPVKVPPAKTQKQGKSVKETGALFRLDNWFEQREKKIFFVLLFLSTLFSILLFDVKVSTGGDDSGYIERAWEFLHNGRYPYYQGPGYPLFLSLFVKFFGLNVVVLKFTSLLCQLGFVWITYITFRKRIPYTVLFALLAFISFNRFIQFYSSQTYTETFFLFLQSICFYVMMKLIDSADQSEGLLDGFKKNYLKWIQFGLAFTLLSLSKSIAFVTIGSVLLYFALNKNFKHVLYVVVAFFAVRMIYQLIVTNVFGPNDSGQLELLLRKDLYKPELGQEDFGGMIDRFFNNLNTYFSLHIFRILNIRGTDANKQFPALANLTGILLCVIAFLSRKRNKYIFFSSLYAIALCAGIFFGVQAKNMQDRLIIIAIPFIFLMLFYGAYQLAKSADVLQYVLILFSAIMLLVTVGKTATQASQNSSVLTKNLGGDIYYGYTPDWSNFLKMSAYAADSLPENSVVLSRKPEMSFMYGHGKKFQGQYWVSTTNADSVLMEWQRENVKYIILASLRMDPKRNTGQVVNTIHRMMQPVQAKYPNRFRLLKTIGTDEAAYLYEVNY